VRSGLRGAAALAVALALLGAAQATGEQRWVEAAGVAKAEPGEARGGPGREAALRAALTQAVQQVAMDLLTASETAAGKPPPDPSALAEKVSRALGSDPTVYVSRFQIREDRGVKPRLLLNDPDAKAEYQLVVMAQVDVARVRQRVGARAPAGPETEPASAGTTKPAPTETSPKPPEASVSTYDVELEAIPSYKEYAAVREALLGKLGVTRAEPVEFSRGRAVLSIDSPIPANQLAGALGKALGGQIRIESVAGASPGAPEGRLRLRVQAGPVSPPAPAGLTR
jgi:hypothetical protein